MFCWRKTFWKAEHSTLTSAHTQKLSYLPTTLQAGLPVVTKHFLLLRFPSMLQDYQVRPDIKRKILKILQCLGWNQIRGALHSGTSQLSCKLWPRPPENAHCEQKPITFPEYVVDSQMGVNELCKTVGKFAEITVNIYFRHSSVHGNVRMFSPQHFFLPSRPYIG